MRFGLAAIFYLFLFLYFLNKNSSKVKRENNIELNINTGLNQEVDNDKTEYFLEGRL